jgi:phospholipid-transporting ATPase
MELKRVSIAGKMFGQASEEKGFNGGAAMDEAKQDSPKDRAAIDAFLEVLSVSHTVVVNETEDGTLKYEAESPDEGALVDTAGQLGWKFIGRVGQKMSIDVSSGGAKQQQAYTVHALNAFNSTRKRMSVIVETASGEYLLLVKGADNVMLERAIGEDTTLMEHLTEFSKEGLRTLVIGRRTLSIEEFTEWHAEYNCAQVAIERRDEQLMEVAEKIEKRLELVGATAIEDKLQVGVGETIVRIRGAGIKLWVLTGDKLETAKNIGFSTKVLSDEMFIPILDVDGQSGEAGIKEQLTELEPHVESEAKQRPVGMMVTGQALGAVTDNGLES